MMEHPVYTYMYVPPVGTNTPFWMIHINTYTNTAANQKKNRLENVCKMNVYTSKMAGVVAYINVWLYINLALYRLRTPPKY